MPRRPQTVSEKIARLAERDPEFRQRHSLQELAKRYGVSRQRIAQIVGPYDGPSPHPRQTGRRKIEAYLRTHPEAIGPVARGGITRKELARACGVGLASIGNHAPGLGIPLRDGQARRKIEAYLRQHPEAIRPLAAGGLTRRELARACGVSVASIGYHATVFGIPLRGRGRPTAAVRPRSR